MALMEEFYSELYDSVQAVTIQTDRDETPPILAWVVSGSNADENAKW